LSAPRTAIHERVTRPRGAPAAPAAAATAAGGAPALEPDCVPYDCDPGEPPAVGVEPLDPPPTIGAPPATGGDGVTWTDVVVTGEVTVGVRTVGTGTVGTGAGGGGGLGTDGTVTVGTGTVGTGGGGAGTGTVTDGTETVGTVIVGVGTETWPSAADAASPPSAHATPTMAAVFTFV
jgi:hypothetical protein